MKTKTLAGIYVIILCIGTMLNLYIPKSEVMADEPLVIPNEAIRLRILANSDSENDQALKRLVRDEVNEAITEWVAELTSIEEARRLIQSKLPEIQKIAENVMDREKSAQKVTVNFGKIEFPTKLYGQFLYPAGEYEAILISLGEGKGANWWCVLFPPLCFLDFSNGVAVSDGFENDTVEKVENKEAEKDKVKENENKEDAAKEKQPMYVEEEEEEVKVKFFFKELWEKIFG